MLTQIKIRKVSIFASVNCELSAGIYIFDENKSFVVFSESCAGCIRNCHMEMQMIVLNADQKGP